MSATDAKREQRLDLADRVALRIEEAASSIGLSERAFREHILPRCPKVYAGRAVVIPTRPFVAFIEAIAAEEGQETQETAASLLARVDPASR